MPSDDSFEGMTEDQINARRRDVERSAYGLTSSLAAAEASKSDQQKLAQTVSGAPVLRDDDMDVYRNLFPNLTPEEFRSGYDLGKRLRGMGERESASASSLDAVIENSPKPLPAWVTDKDSAEGYEIRSKPHLSGLVASMISAGNLPEHFYELEGTARNMDKAQEMIDDGAVNRAIIAHHTRLTGADPERSIKTLSDTLLKNHGQLAAEKFNTHIFQHTKLTPLEKQIESGGYWNNFSSQFKHTSPTTKNVSIGLRETADVPIYIIEAVPLKDGGFAYKAKPAPFDVIQRNLTDAEMNEMAKETLRLNNTTELESSDHTYEIPVKDKDGKPTDKKIKVHIQRPR